VLVRAWRGLKLWRREGRFSTWLFALAANVFRSELKRFPAVNTSIEDAPEPARAAAEESGLAIRQTEEAVGVRFLGCRCGIRSRWCCSISMKWTSAAARTLGLPEGTVKARLARARALPKKRFPHLEDQ
jgi:RNA polymerase sigma-70 factor (ECF subfamily)